MISKKLETALVFAQAVLAAYLLLQPGDRQTLEDANRFLIAVQAVVVKTQQDSKRK